MSDSDLRIRLGLQANTADSAAIQREMARVGQSIDTIFSGIFDTFDKRVADLATKAAAIGQGLAQPGTAPLGAGGMFGLFRAGSGSGASGAPTPGATNAFADAASKATQLASAFVGVDRALASLTSTLSAANAAAGQHVIALSAAHRAMTQATGALAGRLPNAAPRWGESGSAGGGGGGGSAIEQMYQRQYDRSYQETAPRGSDRNASYARDREQAVATAQAHGGILLAHARTESPLGAPTESLAGVSASLTSTLEGIFTTLEKRLGALSAPGGALAPAPAAAAPAAATPAPAASSAGGGGILALLGGGAGAGGSLLKSAAGGVLTAAAMGAAFVGVDKSLSGLMSTISGANAAAAQHTIALGDLQKALQGATGDFTTFRGQLLATGNRLGYSYDQIISMAQTYGATGVRAETSGTRFAQTVGGMEQFASGYGQDPGQMASLFAGMVNQGYGLSSGQPKLAVDIADAVSSGQMNGRMGDVVSELSTLTTQIESTTASTPDLSTLLSVMTTANASGIRGLQGTRGGQVLGTVNQSIESMGSGSPVSQMAWYQALSQGGKLNLAQVKFRSEEGIAGPGNLKDVMSYAHKLYGGYSPDMQLYGESQFMGVSMHQMQALNQAFMKNGVFNDAGYGKLTAGLARFGMTPGQVNQQALPVLAQLFTGGSLSSARGLAATEGFTLPKGSEKMSRDQLIRAILGQTPQDLASRTRQGTQAIPKGAESIAQDLLPFVTRIKDAYGGLLSNIGTAEQGAKSLGDVISRLVRDLDKLVPPPSSLLPNNPIPSNSPFSFLNGPINAGETLLGGIPGWMQGLLLLNARPIAKGGVKAVKALRGRGKGGTPTADEAPPEPPTAETGAAASPDRPPTPATGDTTSPDQAVRDALNARAQAERDAARAAQRLADAQDAAGARIRTSAAQEALAGTRTAQMGAQAEIARESLARLQSAQDTAAARLRTMGDQARILGDAEASAATHQEAANVATTEEAKMAAAQGAKRMAKLAQTETDPRLKKQYEEASRRLNAESMDPAADIPDLSPAVVAVQLYMQGVGALHDSSVQGGKAIATAQNARLTGKYAGVFAEAQQATGIPMADIERGISSASNWNPTTEGGVSGMSAADIAAVNKTFGEQWTAQQLQGSPAASILAEAEYLQMQRVLHPNATTAGTKPLPKPGTRGRLSRTPFPTTAPGQAGAPAGTSLWGYEGGTLMQGFRPGPGALEPNHAGVDVGLPGGSPVTLPQSGRYIQAASSPYRSEFQLANGNYEVLLHLQDATKYKNDQLVAAGTRIGQVDPTRHTPADKYTVREYGGAVGGPYISEGSHVHIAEYGARYGSQAQFDQNMGALNPNALFATSAALTAAQQRTLAGGTGSGSGGGGALGAVPAYVPPAYRAMVAQAAQANNVPTALLAAQIQQESGFRPGVVNSSGAAGLGQIMPGTAKAWGVNPLDPQAAIGAMASHDAAAFKKYGSYQDALAAYNAGGGAVDQFGGVPPYAETQAYVAQIMTRYQHPGPLAPASAPGQGGGALAVSVAPIQITLKTPDGKTHTTKVAARAVYHGVKTSATAPLVPFAPSPVAKGYLGGLLTGGR